MGVCDFQGCEAESLDSGQDIVGGLDPFEGLRALVVMVDVADDRCLEFPSGAVDATADLPLRHLSEEALYMVDP